MAESMPPTFEQLRQLNRSLNEQVLNRAESDPRWRQLLLDDPELAMREANFPELQQIVAAAGGAGGDEVRGQAFDVQCHKICYAWSSLNPGTHQTR